MTCVVGIKNNGRVYIGADSAGVREDLSVFRYSEPKVFLNGELLIGFSGSWRIGQILQHCDLPQPSVLIKKPHEFAHVLVGEIIEILANNRSLSEKKGIAYSESEIMIGWGDNLISIDSDMHYRFMVEEYQAIGIGSHLALGSLYTSEKLLKSPTKRIESALSAASTFCSGVCPPYHILNT